MIGPVGRDDAREMARRELRNQIYHHDDPSLIDRALKRINDWLNSIFSRGPGSSHASSGLSWGGLIVIIAMLALVIGGIWWRSGGMRRNAAERGALLDEKGGTAKGHRGAAETLAAAGRWAEAIRERLRAIALDLEERAILDPRPGRTADELAAEAAAALPGKAAALREGARIFDDVWYGGRRATSAGYERLTALDAEVRAARPAQYSIARGARPTERVP